MNYEAAVKSIVNRLAPFKTVGIQVAILPESAGEWKKTFQKGRIYVAYKSSKWADKIKSTGFAMQDEEVIFELTFQSRRLLDEIGVYNLMATTIRALVGFTPPNCDRMYCKEGGMTGVATLEDDLWTYSLLMACSNINVEDYEEDLSVLIKSFTNLQVDETGELTGQKFDVPSGSIEVITVEETP